MPVQNFTKIINPCKTQTDAYRTYDTFCKITYKDGKLSITGVEGPYKDGNCAGACGQIVMHEWEPTEYKEGWDAAKLDKFLRIWKRWYLNDMRAGSPAQERVIKGANLEDKTYAEKVIALDKLGFDPAPDYRHGGKPYYYGGAWLLEPIPKVVLKWLAALPETTIQPAWV